MTLAVHILQAGSPNLREIFRHVQYHSFIASTAGISNQVSVSRPGLVPLPENLTPPGKKEGLFGGDGQFLWVTMATALLWVVS